MVTGGTKGAGAAIAQRLAEAGATVLVTARSMPADFPAPDLFISADISTADGTNTVITTALDRLGSVDILVNAVGGSEAPAGGFAALTDEHWKQALISTYWLPCDWTEAYCLRCWRRARARSCTSPPSSGACRCMKPRSPTLLPKPH